MDSIINEFDKSMNLSSSSKFDKLQPHFINDINIIINEMININNITAINSNFYELLVSLGSNLIWNNEYFISEFDFDWLKDEGKVYLITKIHESVPIITLEDYNNLLNIHNQICQIFSLQVQE